MTTFTTLLKESTDYSAAKKALDPVHDSARDPRTHEIVRVPAGDKYNTGIRRLEDRVDQAKREGAIGPSHHQELKQSANYYLEKAWNHHYTDKYLASPHVGDTYKRELDNLSPQFNEVYYGHPSLHTLAKKEKDVSKLPDHPLKHAAMAVINAFKPIAKDVEELKGKIQKRVTKAESEPKDQTKFHKNYSAAAFKMVSTAMDPIVQSHHPRLKEYYSNHLHNQVKQYRDARAAHPERKWNEPWGKDPRGYKYPIGPVGRYLDSRSEGVSQDHVAKIDADAHGMATSVVEHFNHKVHKKIASIADKEGGIHSIAQSNVGGLGALQGELHIKHGNGTEYHARVQVVPGVSKYGVHFARYPLTFHNIKMSDGTKHKFRSEEQINNLLK